jgi:hypothetical protein
MVLGVIGFSIPFWLNPHTKKLPGRFSYTLDLRDEFGWELALGFTSFVIAGAGVVGTTLGVKAHYRCPRCESLPMSLRAGGLLLFPTSCPECGARLS